MAPSPWLRISTERFIRGWHFNVCWTYLNYQESWHIESWRCLRVSGNIVWCWCLQLCVCVLMCVSLILFLYSFPQQKGPSYRFGVPVPSGGHLPWTLLQGHTSQASGLGTPMDPTLPVWKTKPHRYIPFRRKTLSLIQVWLGVGHIEWSCSDIVLF